MDKGGIKISNKTKGFEELNLQTLFYVIKDLISLWKRLPFLSR